MLRLWRISHLPLIRAPLGLTRSTSPRLLPSSSCSCHLLSSRPFATSARSRFRRKPIATAPLSRRPLLLSSRHITDEWHASNKHVVWRYVAVAHKHKEIAMTAHKVTPVQVQGQGKEQAQIPSTSTSTTSTTTSTPESTSTPTQPSQPLLIGSTTPTRTRIQTNAQRHKLTQTLSSLINTATSPLAPVTPDVDTMTAMELVHHYYQQQYKQKYGSGDATASTSTSTSTQTSTSTSTQTSTSTETSTSSDPFALSDFQSFTSTLTPTSMLPPEPYPSVARSKSTSPSTSPSSSPSTPSIASASQLFLTEFNAMLHAYAVLGHAPFILRTILAQHQVHDVWIRNQHKRKKQSIDMMIEGAMSAPDASSYQHLMTAYVVCNDIDGCLMTLSRIEMYKLEATSGTLEALFRMYVMKGDAQGAQDMVERLRRMPTYSHLSLTGTYTILMHGFAKHGYIDAAMHMFMTLEKMGFVIDIYTYHALINAYARKGQFDTAYRIMRDMEAASVAPTSRTYALLINAASRAHRLSDARMILDRMLHVHSKGYIPDSKVKLKSPLILDVEPFYSMIMALIANKNIDAAKDILPMIRSHNIKIDSNCYTVLIRAFITDDRLDEAKSLLHDALHIDNITPKLDFYVVQLHIAAIEKDTEKATQIYRDLLAAGHRPDQHVIKMLALTYERANEQRGQHWLLQELQRLQMIPPRSVVQSILKTAAKNQNLPFLRASLDLFTRTAPHFNHDPIVKWAHSVLDGTASSNEPPTPTRKMVEQIDAQVTHAIETHPQDITNVAVPQEETDETTSTS